MDGGSAVAEEMKASRIVQFGYPTQLRSSFVAVVIAGGLQHFCVRTVYPVPSGDNPYLCSRQKIGLP